MNFQTVLATVLTLVAPLPERGTVGESIVSLTARQPERLFSEAATTGRTFGASRFVRASFGAVFTEISINPLTLKMPVKRMVGAFACGRDGGSRSGP